MRKTHGGGHRAGAPRPRGGGPPRSHRTGSGPRREGGGAQDDRRRRPGGTRHPDERPRRHEGGAPRTDERPRRREGGAPRAEERPRRHAGGSRRFGNAQRPTGRPNPASPRPAPADPAHVATEVPSAAALRALFARSGLRLSDLQTQQFWTFHQLLRRRNDELDLTRLHAFETIVLKHYVDCALVATLVDLPSPLLDLGTGAGFPGIPLKIVRPDVKLFLAEPRHKRVEFLEEAIRELGLRDVEVVPHKIGSRFDMPVHGVVTRAVESIPSTLERVAPWLEPGARLLFMKGPGVDAEVEAARRDWSDTFRVLRDVPYSIPQTPHTRRLVVLERTAAAVLDTEDGDLQPVHEASRGARLASAPDEDAWVEGAQDAETLLDDAVLDDEDSDDAPAAPAPVDVRATQAAIRDFDATQPTPAASPRVVRELASVTNPTYKLLRAVLTPRGVRKHQRALLAGIRPILEVLRDHPERARAWVTSGPAPSPPAGAAPGMTWLRVAPEHFRALDPAGTGGPLLLLDAPPLEAWSDADWPPGCTLFVPFQDPENVGTVIRTAAAFGVARVVLLREAANPFHPKSARAAGSALLRVPLLRGPEIAAFEPKGAPVFALSPVGNDVGEIAFPDRFGLLLGLEGPGLPAAWRSERAISIPMQSGVDSLNAAAAAAIALYLWSRSESG